MGADDTTILIRADANAQIGSGHVVRCLSVARAATAAGTSAAFAASDARTLDILGSHPFPVEMLSGNVTRYDADDALELARIAHAKGTRVLLIDSYAITDVFLDTLAEALPKECVVAYFDDLFTYERGKLAEPLCYPVDVTINYAFGATRGMYACALDAEDVDGGRRRPGRRALVGPAYAPIRDSFRCRSWDLHETIGSVLVTSGSTNPGSALERMFLGCFSAVPGAHFDIVVGPKATFDSSVIEGRDATLLRGLDDLAPYMERSDLVVSAAGTTLYELACVGVPTVAVPIVENQLFNASGFSAILGVPMLPIDWKPGDIARVVSQSYRDAAARKGISRALREAVDGRGAARIVEELLAEKR